MGNRKRLRHGVVIGAISGLLLLIGANYSGAFISTPTQNSVVRGNVFINETEGGKSDIFCSSGSSTIAVFNNSNVQVFSQTRNGNGGWSTTWPTHGLSLGSYRIQSTRVYRHFHVFGGCHSHNDTLSNFLVTLDNLSTTSYTGATSVYYLEPLPVSGNLRDATTGVPIASRALNFTLLGGGSSGSAITNGSGNASTSLLANLAPGAHTVRTSFAQDCCWRGSSIDRAIQILHRPTAVSYVGEDAVFSQETATVAARLTDVRNGGSPVAGKSVLFELLSGGSPIRSVSADTDGAGLASTGLLADVDAGTYSVRATFAGDALFSGSSTVGALQVLHRPTSLAYVGDTEGYWTETAAVRAVLTDVRSGSPVAGKPIAFSLGTATTSAGTDALGIAASTIDLNQDPGSYTAAAAFPGDGVYSGSSNSTAFTILKRPTSLAYDGATSGPRGSTANLSATLTDVRNGSGVGGKLVTFTLGSFSDAATTDANGMASVQAPLDQDPNASYTVAASFDEDGFYLGSGDAEPFVIGWEYTFVDGLGRGTIYVNTSTKEFRFSAPGDTSEIKQDADMRIIELPQGVNTPEPPCDTGDPGSCAPEPPCDPGTPEGCIPVSPPECVDDPAGGDPICPADYIPAAGPSSDSHVCVTSPIDGTPVCAPDVPGTPAPPIPCDLELAAGCDERFVIVTYSDGQITLAGVFDLELGEFVAAARTAVGTYELHSTGSVVPPPPPPPPCDPETPEACIPPAPEPPAVPDCIDDPLGGEPICKP